MKFVGYSSAYANIMFSSSSLKALHISSFELNIVTATFISPHDLHFSYKTFEIDNNTRKDLFPSAWKYMRLYL